jgi:2-iminobutanoate/2-iminopropanoate deaminase
MKKLILFTLSILFWVPLLAQQTTKMIINTDKAPKPIGPYSQAIMQGNTLYLSGQIAIIPETGKMDTLDITTEVRRIMKNLGAILNAAEMDYKNIVKTTIYTTDLENFKTINTTYGEYFKDNPPARETVQVVALPAKAHVEISCIAVK